MDWRTRAYGELVFNPAPSTVMHIDLNSCFASIEQQANPYLRGRPLAVAAYDSPGGCILAASREAKEFGVKTGMRVKDGRALCPHLLVRLPDADKYRFVHARLNDIIGDYTSTFVSKSIDEFVLNLANHHTLKRGLFIIAGEIKKRIRDEVGNWLTVSIGLGPSQFTAKMASGLKKPDGLMEFSANNYQEIYDRITLTDLHGINNRNAARLNSVEIYTPQEMYNAPLWRLKAAFHSILSYYWFVRLRGWEIDNIAFKRRSYGNSYALPYHDGELDSLLPILQKLTEKAGMRMRRAGYRARGVYLSLYFRDRGYWHRVRTLHREIFDSRDIFREAVVTLRSCPRLVPVHTLTVSCVNLTRQDFYQTELFEDIPKKRLLTQAVDTVNARWGDFVVTAGRVTLASDAVQDRISFGNVRE